MNEDFESLVAPRKGSPSSGGGRAASRTGVVLAAVLLVLAILLALWLPPREMGRLDAVLTPATSPEQAP